MKGVFKAEIRSRPIRTFLVCERRKEEAKGRKGRQRTSSLDVAI